MLRECRYKPVGKTADEAVQIYKDVLAYQEAGAIAVEMELVPEMVAAEISKRVSILTISLGSGQGCDVQYLFACDILNITEGHIPRHAKSYVDLQPERKRLHEKSVQGFAAFHREVTSCQFPRPVNNLKISEEEFDRFLTHAQALG